MASQSYTATTAHGRSRSYVSQGPFYLPTPPYIPMPVATKSTPSARNPNGPSSLAKLAASATLTLLPQHRANISVMVFAKLIHRYLALVRLPPVITHLTLLYIYRLTKSGFPVHEYTAQQIFVTAYALADTYLDDNAYSNKSWLQVLNDGTDMREWTRMEFHFLKGLKWRLEASDREWNQWCEWVCDWWHRAGASDWERLEALEAQKTLSKPHATVSVVAPHPVRAVASTASRASPDVHPARAMSVDRDVGVSAGASAKLSQLGKYQWEAPDSDSETEPEDEAETEEEEEGIYVEAKPKEHVIRRKDSGYCEVAVAKPIAKVEEKTVTKKSSFSFKWNFF